MIKNIILISNHSSTMPAFVSSPFVSSSSSAFVAAASSKSNVLSLPRNVRRRATITAVVPEDATSIDFGKVDIQGAGENLAGLVFTPEADTTVKTRCNVGYTNLQEAAVNRHINVEYTAMYAYHAIWAYFDRDTVALPGFARYFHQQSAEERDHAEGFMKYQNKRGGTVELQPIAVPEMKFAMEDGTSDAIYAMDLHLQLEKFVFHKLNDLHKVASDAGDAQMQDFIEHYLTHQVESIKAAADYVAQLKRVGTPHGVYHVDLTLREHA